MPAELTRYLGLDKRLSIQYELKQTYKQCYLLSFMFGILVDE